MTKTKRPHEVHKCSYDCHIECTADSSGYMEIIDSQVNGPIFQVNFCPFCGRKALEFTVYSEVLDNPYEVDNDKD